MNLGRKWGRRDGAEGRSFWNSDLTSHPSQLCFCFLGLLEGALFMHSDLPDTCSLCSSQQTLCNPSAMSQLICVYPDLELERRERWFHVTHLPWGAEVHQVVSRLPGFSLSLLTASYLSTHFPRYVHWFPKFLPVFFPSGGISSDLTCLLRVILSGLYYPERNG